MESNFAAFSDAVLPMTAAKESLQLLAIEGTRVEFECRTNSALEIEWHLITKTNNYSSLKIFHVDRSISDQLKRDHYSLKVVNVSSQTLLFVLSVENVESSDAGIYECRNSSSQSPIVTIRLVVSSRHAHPSRTALLRLHFHK